MLLTDCERKFQMAANITKATNLSVADYLATISDEQRRIDCKALITLMEKAKQTSASALG